MCCLYSVDVKKQTHLTPERQALAPTLADGDLSRCGLVALPDGLAGLPALRRLGASISFRMLH